MKVKIVIVSLLMSLMANFCFGQSFETKNDCLQRLETLFEEGRKNYVDIGDRSQLKRITEEFKRTLDKAYADGMITPKDREELLLNVKYDKLCGDMHYLNANEDSRSYDSAEIHFKKALSFVEDPRHATFQEVNYYQFVFHEELGQLFYKQNRYEEAYKEMKKAENKAFYLNNDEDILDFISQLAICKARVMDFKGALDDINRVIESYPSKKGERYGEALRKKAKILMLQQENGDTGMDDSSGEALNCYKEYYTLKKADALQRLGDMSAQEREPYWMRIRPFVMDCYRTEDADPAFLYDVTLFGKSLLLEYAKNGKPQSFTWKQVQQKLQSTECAVEFIQYEKYGNKHMGALVLKKKGKPEFVWIGALYDIETLWLDEDVDLYDAVTEDQKWMKNLLYGDSTLYQFIWTPELLQAIGKDTRRLYFAADGLFHNLAIEYMLPNAPELTSLKTENLYRLTSTRQLIGQTNKKRNGKTLLGGGIDFLGTPQNAFEDSEASYSNDERAYKFLKAVDAQFLPIDGTKAEIEGICEEYDSDKVTVLTGAEATEARMATLIQQHSNVHLATHGFFYGIVPEGTDLLPASYDESLSQSGIALAGSTSALESNDFKATQHDGILSAREIMRMDFSGVDLIVLSACQTALGYMTDDGIYGLQRSLKVAGVKSMILSLWSVDDDATSALMQAFYRHLNTEDIHTAFMHAREELINTARKSIGEFDPVRLVVTKTEPDFNNPYFYNAFILIDIK